MNKILLLWQALHEGYEVTNAEKWKKGTISVNAVAAILSALLMFVDTDINKETVANVAAGIIAAVNIVMHVITSKKVGM